MTAVFEITSGQTTGEIAMETDAQVKEMTFITDAFASVGKYIFIKGREFRINRILKFIF